MGQGSPTEILGSLEQDGDSKGAVAAINPDAMRRLYEWYCGSVRKSMSARSCQSFAKHIVEWHMERGRLPRDAKVKKEVYRCLMVLQSCAPARLPARPLRWPEFCTKWVWSIVTRYRFPKNQQRTEHVLEAVLGEALSLRAEGAPSARARIVSIIASYTTSWGFHRGKFIGFGVNQGFWRNGWGYEVFNPAEPHPIHASSHTRAGTGLQHWSCCGSVIRGSNFCYARPVDRKSDSKSRRGRRRNNRSSNTPPTNTPNSSPSPPRRKVNESRSSVRKSISREVDDMDSGGDRKEAPRSV